MSIFPLNEIKKNRFVFNGIPFFCLAMYVMRLNFQELTVLLT